MPEPEIRNGSGRLLFVGWRPGFRTSIVKRILLVTNSTHGIDAQGAPGWQHRGQGDDDDENSNGSQISDGIEIVDAVENLAQDMRQRGGSTYTDQQSTDDWAR